VAVSPAGLDVSGLIVAARMGDPVLAAAVANALAQQIVDLGSAGQQARFDETLAFLKEQEQRVAAEIAALDREITDYKNANLDSLPEAMTAMRDELRSIDTALRDLDGQRIALQSERARLDDGQALRAVQTRQLEQIDSQLLLLANQSEALERRRTEINAAIQRAPAADMVLSGYDRRREQLAEEYTAIARRLAEAETGRRLARNESIEQFTLVESAVAPDWPMQSGRRRIAILGAAVSVLAGLALAVLLDLVNPVLRTAGQMQRALEIRPVVTIPYIPTSRELQRRKALRFAGLGVALLLLVFGAAAFAL
jgi:uncharacterized protein involved in exopolysaccharide biosynthesis